MRLCLLLLFLHVRFNIARGQDELLPELYTSLETTTYEPVEEEAEDAVLRIDTVPECPTSEESISFNFSSTGLNRIGSHFIDSPLVTCLSLSNNGITEISSDAFAGLPNLHLLDLSGNENLRNILFINSHKNLKILVLDRNRMDNYNNYLATLSIWRSMQTFPKLKILYMRHNNLRESKWDLNYVTPNLEILFFSGNLIGEDSETSFFDQLPPTLTHLILDSNSIRTVKVPQLKYLLYVSFDKNQIENLCNSYCPYFGLSLKGITKLQYLSISANKINDMAPDAFDDAQNLVYLDLSKNNINVIPSKVFRSLANLRYLYMNNNQLTEVPDITSMINLRNLSLSGNKIESIPSGAFGNLNMLRSLTLDGNSIMNIEIGAFDNLTSLVYLDLSENNLSYLPSEWIFPETNLQTLLMKNNHFRSFENISIKSARKLANIYLEGNPIMHFNLKSFDEMPRNLSVHLQTGCSSEGVEVYRRYG